MCETRNARRAVSSRAFISQSATRIVPCAGDKIPEIKCSKVVLPDPLGPMIATRSPSAIFDRWNGQAKIGMGKMKFKTGDVDHNFLNITALFT